MKLNLTNAEMGAMWSFLDAITTQLKAGENDAEILLYKCLFDYMDYEVKKLYLKNKPHYKFTLKPEWALAFWAYVNPQLDDIKDPHLNNLLLTICNNIHKKYLT